MSTLSELRAALSRVKVEQDRIRSEITTKKLLLEQTERERLRLEAQIRAVTQVPQDRQVNVPGRQGAA